MLAMENPADFHSLMSAILMLAIESESVVLVPATENEVLFLC